MSKWQPIETAPKDGTRILLLCARVVGSIRTGHWYSLTRQVDGDVSYRYEGWWLDGFDHPFTESPFTPSHWMPLPDPPVAQMEGR